MTTSKHDFTAVPPDLRALPHWVCWRLEEVRDKKQNAKLTKVPYNAKSGAKASSTNEKTWATFDTATDALNRSETASGIGFVVTIQSGFVGVDLDHCIDLENGTIEDWALDVLTALDSYTEITPSGTGLRIFARGTLPDGGRKKGNFEIYNSGRFLTITGRHFASTPLEINERTAQIAEIHKNIFGAPKPKAPALPPSMLNGVGAFTGTDSELLEAMFKASNGAKIQALFNGDYSAHGSQSEADSALCFHLAFWTNRDAARIDAIFRQSGLMREKWDTVHHGDGSTYGARTVAEAVARVTETRGESRQIILGGAGARAFIGGKSEEHAEAESAADEPDEESAPDSLDPTEAALNRGLYRLSRGRTMLLISKEKEGETGSEENTKKAFIADMSAFIHEVRKDEEGSQLFVAAGREVGGRRFSVEFDAAKFTDPKYVSAQLSNATSPACVFYAGMEKHLAPCIRSFTDMKAVSVVRQFNRVGWANNETEFIIPGMEAADVTIHLNRDLAYRVEPPNDGQEELSPEARTALAALLAAHNPTLTTIAVCYALLAPLAGLADWRDDRFGLFIAGRTGTFKTSFACMALCLYGDFPNEDKMLKFGQGATLNAMLSQASSVRDMVMGIDNFKPGTGSGQRDAQGFIHGALEGGERKRLNRDGTQRTTKEVYCWPMMTGEDTIDDAASIARMIVVNAAWDGVENPRLTEIQGLCHHLPEVGGFWLSWMQGPEVREQLKTASRQFPARRAAWATFLRRKQPDMVNASRVASSLTLLELCWGVARSCPALAPVLAPYDALFTDGLAEVAASMGQYAAQTHEANRYIAALRALLDSGRAYLLPKHLDADKDDRRIFLGWTDDDVIYLQPDNAYAEVLKFLRDGGGLNGLGMNTIHKQLDQLGYLARKDAGHYAVLKRLGSTNNAKRVLWLHREKALGSETGDADEGDE